MRRLVAGLALLVAACPTRYPDDRPFFGGDVVQGPDGAVSQPAPPISAQPLLPQVVTQDKPPPPVSGGTLAILKDSTTAVASDPDRDHIFVVDLKQRTKLADIALNAGDEPGRIIEDYDGRVHVVLRGGGLLTISNRDWQHGVRRDVCPEPRGIAYQQASNSVHVACAGGELVTLPAAGGAATRTLQLQSDLRDVVVNGSRVLVSRFRSAELISVASDGTIDGQTKPEKAFAFRGTFSPGGAWRMIAAPANNQVFMLHQRGLEDTVETEQPGGYGNGTDPCSPIVQTTISSLQIGQKPLSVPAVSRAVVAVDVAFSPSTLRLAIVSAGNSYNPGEPTVFETPAPSNHEPSDSCQQAETETKVDGEATAVAYDDQGELYVQTREPAAIVNAFSGVTITLSNESRADSGHAIFHANAGGDMACASCHMEGGEDGRVWTFSDSGARRTQSLRGGILGTEPFHWSGDQKDLSTLMHGVFEQRMSGPKLDETYLAALGGWVNTVPLLRHGAAADAAAVARGKSLFEDSAECSSCHAGDTLTDNSTTNVGTGEPLQTPTLRGLKFRAPYLHDGRAPTLRDRFDATGGLDKHGKTTQLSSGDIDDLVAYLETL